MAKIDVDTPKITRGDKMHKKRMDKLNIFKDGLTYSLDSYALIHKQTLDSSAEYFEKISKSQEPERIMLCEIIKTCEDEKRRKEARERLKELDQIKAETIEKHNVFIQSEGDNTNKNITGSIHALAAVCGLIVIPNKRLRQMTGKVLNTVNKSFLPVKE